MPPSDPPSVSGTLVAQMLAAAREALGREVVGKGLSAIAPAKRAELEQAIPGAWVRLTVVEEGFQAIADVAGCDLANLHVELARISLEKTLSSLWRVLLRFTTDSALLSRSPVIFSKAYNCGRLITSIPEPGRALVQITDWPDLPEWPIRATRVGIETVLKLAGRREVRIATEPTPNGASYVATWR